MRLAVLILGCVSLGALLVGWMLRRFGVAWGALVSFFARLLLQLTAALVLAWAAIGAAGLGGVWYGALAAALGTLSLGTLMLIGFLAWGVLKYGPDGED